MERLSIASVVLLVACAGDPWTFVGPTDTPNFEQAKAACYGQVSQQPTNSYGAVLIELFFYRQRLEACMRGQGWQQVPR